MTAAAVLDSTAHTYQYLEVRNGTNGLKTVLHMGNGDHLTGPRNYEVLPIMRKVIAKFPLTMDILTYVPWAAFGCVEAMGYVMLLLSVR